MTSRDLLHAALRRWYVMIIGAVVSLGFVYVATHQPPVYWTQFNVLLIGPKNPEFPNYLEDSRYALDPIVGLVVNDENKGESTMVTASTETNMVGQGLTDGVQVRVPNLGTQWRRNPSANYIDVQVAAPTLKELLRRVDTTLDEVAAALDVRQDELGIVPGMRVTSVATTDDPTVYTVSGNRIRAAAASGMSGAAVTLVLVYWLERRPSTRSSHSGPREARRSSGRNKTRTAARAMASPRAALLDSRSTRASQ